MDSDSEEDEGEEEIIEHLHKTPQTFQIPAAQYSQTPERETGLPTIKKGFISLEELEGNSDSSGVASQQAQPLNQQQTPQNSQQQNAVPNIPQNMQTLMFPPWWYGVPNFPPELIQVLISENRLPLELAEVIKKNFEAFQAMPQEKKNALQRQILVQEQPRMLQIRHQMMLHQQRLLERQRMEQNKSQSLPENTLKITPPNPSSLLISKEQLESLHIFQPRQPPTAEQASPTQSSDTHKSSRNSRGPTPYKQHTHVHNIDWRKNKKRMTAQDISNVLKVTNHQLRYSNFAEDFYYQTYMKKNAKKVNDLSLPPVQSTHEPIAFIGKSPTPAKNPELFSGVLGTLSLGSAKAPRIEIDLNGLNALNLDTLILKNTEQPTETSRALDCLLHGSVSLHALWLVIEELFDVVLDLEDLNTVLSNLDGNMFPKEYEEAEEKREDIIAYLTKRIAHFVKQENPLSPNPLFSKLIQVAKGRKLLSRVVKLVEPQIGFFFFHHPI